MHILSDDIEHFTRKIKELEERIAQKGQEI